MWLDGRLGTSPWLTVTGLVLGMVAGFLEMWRLVDTTRMVSERTQRPEKSEHDENQPD
jgi:F0F1-type ATP synthase assembly protein I